MAAAQVTADVTPRVFEERFTNDNTVLYVDDVKTETGSVAEWDRVFIADLTPPPRAPDRFQKEAQSIGPRKMHAGLREGSPPFPTREEQSHPVDAARRKCP